MMRIINTDSNQIDYKKTYRPNKISAKPVGLWYAIDNEWIDWCNDNMPDWVKHGNGEYVLNDCHTNTLEGFFSLLKRGIVGIYHFVSAKHLDNYLNEFTFRYNSKGYSEESRFNLLLSSCDAKRLTYNNLIKND